MGPGQWGHLLVQPLSSASDVQSQQEEGKAGPQPPGAPALLSLRAATQASGQASDQETDSEQQCWVKVSDCVAPIEATLLF